VVNSSLWPLSWPGSLRIASILSARTITALVFDSSLVMPIVIRPKRAAPSTAGTEPVPPTSQESACAAATCGAPAGKVANDGSRPTSFHQPFSVAM